MRYATIPLENPYAALQFIQLFQYRFGFNFYNDFSLVLISCCTGRQSGSAWPDLVSVGVTVAYRVKRRGTRLFHGVESARQPHRPGGNMAGKEGYGIANTALWVTVTTDTIVAYQAGTICLCPGGMVSLVNMLRVKSSLAASAQGCTAF